MSSQTAIAEEFNLATESTSVTVRKLLTPRGQLVEIESNGDDTESADQIRVDALGLESLSWQTEEDLVDRLGRSPPAEWDAESESQSLGAFELSNEYADVVVSKVETTTGDALIVRAPVKRTELRLHPVMVRELTTWKTDLFSEFLEEPHGPHDH